MKPATSKVQSEISTIFYQLNHMHLLGPKNWRVHNHQTTIIHTQIFKPICFAVTI